MNRLRTNRLRTNRHRTTRLRATRRPAIALVGAALAVSTLAACGANSAAGADEAGEKFTFALASDPSCLNPRVAGNNDAAYPSRQLVDSLTDQDPETGEIKPWLAESFEANSDATAYTFRLRPGVSFSDGTPLTADIVRANFDEVISNGAEQPTALSFLNNYSRTDVVDEHTAVVHFDKPNAAFLQATASHFLGLLAPSSLQTAPPDRCAGNLVGTGPFVLDHYTAATEVVEHRRDDYAWGSSLWQEPNRPAASRQLVFKVIPEAGVRTGVLKSRQVDAIGGVPPQDEAGLEQGKRFGLQARANPGLVFGWRVNVKRPIVADENVRRALTRAIDRQAVTSSVLSDNYAPATSTIARTTPGWSDGSAALAHDVDGAKALLDRAGWIEGPDGIRVKDGRPLKLKAIWATNFNPNQPALELLQQQLRTVGVEVELVQSEIGNYNALQKQGDYDLTWGNSTRPDPDILRASYGSASNLGIDDPELAEALQAQLSTADPAGRAAAAARAQEIVVDKGYGLPVFELTTVLGLGEHTTGVRFDSYSRLQLRDARSS